ICGEYFYSEIYDPENDLEQLAFSKDGIYWEYAGMSDIRYIINVYEKNDDIIVRFFNDTETGPGANLSFIDKNSLYSQLENNLSDTNVYVRLNDKILGFDQPPVTENDRTLVPMRFLFEQMGAEVTWDDATQTATATVPVTTEEEIQTFGLAEEKSVTFSVDNTTATVNGSVATMDVPARLINDKTMVPLRFLSENLGFNVQWDEATRTAIVTTE
ncbi:MAG TPA: copper amine oxidase N-terminal domain-containing protein, partial [Firmicutes bacterium]|nr:copper amine oxidase N-terminal domain-containing protein [Bacillota bacterium]